MTLPTFETSRLILKEVTDVDIPAYERHFVDYEVIRTLSAVVPWPYPQDGVGNFLKTLVFPFQGVSVWMWGLFLKKNPSELIGAVDFRKSGRPENRGFWLAQKFWTQGLMTEAVTPLMDYAFDSLGFEKMTFANAVGNPASRRVKEKTGARFVGIRSGKFVDPNLTESEYWEITREEWRRARKIASLQP
jgi:ribosomal-protein-alanine N-acetyltransferase